MTLDNLQILQARDKEKEGSSWLLSHIAHGNIKKKNLSCTAHRNLLGTQSCLLETKLALVRLQLKLLLGVKVITVVVTTRRSVPKATHSR